MSRPNPVGAVVALLASCVLLRPNTATAQESDLQFHDGLVTLVAREMAVRTILTQWARTGRVTVVNGDKVEGPPVTLQLVDVPEHDALAILLRSAGGYVTAARRDFQPGASVFDRIVVVAPSAVRNSSPQLAAQLNPPPATVESADFIQGIANQSAEPVVDSGPPQSAARPGAAPFAPGAPGPFAARANSTGPAVAPSGASAGPVGTARPGEVATPPPASRTSPGPQRQQQ